MTLLPMLVAILLVPSSEAAQQPSPMPEGTASISGRVTSADSGKAIAGALVEIVIYENLSGRFGQVATDASGRFQFSKLPAGHFRVAAQATRYMRMQWGQQQPGPAGLLNPPRTIELVDGQAFTTADFALSSFCAIEGVVTDEFGDPVPNVAVQVSQVQYAGGRKRLLPANPSTDVGPSRATDDQGHFRVAGLAPGDYYVEALSGAFSDPNAAGGFAITYYPGTTRASNAQAVTVQSGRDAVNVSFALSPAEMAQVSGTVVGADGRPLARSTLMLMPSERTGAVLFAMVRTVSGTNGEFTFRNLAPGTYTIQVFGAPVGTGGNLGASAFGYETFTVNGRDLDGLTVKVPAPRTLRGRITFEGTTPPPRAGDVFISALPVNFESSPAGGGPPPTTIRDDLTFEVRAMSGLRAINAGARPGWILKRVTLNGENVTDQAVDLREHDVDGIEIVLTTTTTTLSGTAVGADGKPPADFNVVVFADDETKWTPWSRYVGFTRGSAQGTFAFRGLPPASYVVVPVTALVNGEWQDPEFLQKLRVRADAVRLTLAAGETKTITLTIKK